MLFPSALTITANSKHHSMIVRSCVSEDKDKDVGVVVVDGVVDDRSLYYYSILA